MAKAKVKKKISTRAAQSVETKIVEMSLQNPELGARRLAPLLKKRRIYLSATAIQNILRRHGLQSREKRLAKLEAQSKKARKPKSPPKKPAVKITDEVAEHIVETSLKNPELGARHLVPLLKKKSVNVSATAIQNILRRHGLQSREKRLAKLEAQSKKACKSKSQIKKPSNKITGAAAERIVEISLQHPEMGVRRLIPLLQQDGIEVSTSAAYRILKRNNLENQQKRFLKLEARLDLEAIAETEVEGPKFLTETAEKLPTAAGGELTEAISEPPVAAPIPPGNQVPAPTDMPEPVLESAVVAPAERERQSLRKAPAKLVKKRSHPAFYPLYLLLLVLIGYLGFHGFQAIQYVRSETGTMSDSESAASGIIAKVESAASERPLEGYSRIWERNLFKIARPGDSELVKQIAIEKVAPAEKDLGLKLVGTVVADDAMLRRAFIDNSKTQRQKAYREGDAVGGVRIKKILRNRVIVGTAEGDRLLMVDIGGASESSNSASYAQQISVGIEYPQQIAGRRRPGRSFKLAREEVVASLADIDKLEQQLNIEPFMKDDQPAGFTIGNIPPESILRKMGLKTGNAIMGVNDEAITSPEQAAEFFQTLAQGGEKTIKARIGRGVRSRTRYFHLIIE